MNETLQNQFIQITNNNKPSLTEINKNIFAATERYIEVKKRFEEKHKLHQKVSSPKYARKNVSCNYAVDVEFKNSENSKKCTLCIKTNFKADHLIY